MLFTPHLSRVDDKKGHSIESMSTITVHPVPRVFIWPDKRLNPVRSFEEMQPGALGSHWDDRESPFDPLLNSLVKAAPDAPQGPLALRMFGQAGTHYIEKYGANPEIFGKVSVKTRKHAEKNPYAILRTPMTLDDVMASPAIYEPYLHRFMACPPNCGGAAVVVCSKEFANRHGIDAGVEIVGQALVTDLENSWDNPIDLTGAKMTAEAARQVYEQAGLGPEDVQVVELHDCFTPNEVITYEELGLCAEGEAEKLIEDEDNTYGGKFVVNPSGGLMSKGHPIGATGLAQANELVNQLRGQAEDRQVAGASVALQHNLGLGGAAVVTMYQKI